MKGQTIGIAADVADDDQQAFGNLLNTKNFLAGQNNFPVDGQTGGRPGPPPTTAISDSTMMAS
jgi:hypothetical protein